MNFLLWTGFVSALLLIFQARSSWAAEYPRLGWGMVVLVETLIIIALTALLVGLVAYIAHSLR